MKPRRVFLLLIVMAVVSWLTMNAYLDEHSYLREAAGYAAPKQSEMNGLPYSVVALKDLYKKMGAERAGLALRLIGEALVAEEDESERARILRDAVDGMNENAASVLKKVFIDEFSRGSKDASREEEVGRRIAAQSEGAPHGASADTAAVERRRCLPEVQQSFFCPAHLSNTSEWYHKWRHLLKWKHADHAELEDAPNVARAATWWCDKILSSLRPWDKKPRYKPEDVVIGVASGENLIYSRTSASRDTWMMRFPNTLIYGVHSVPSVPMLGLKDLGYPLPATLQVQYVQQYIHFYALRDMIRRRPNAKWYWLGGCDNFLHRDYFLHILDSYDSDEALWVAPSAWGPSPLPPKWSLDEWPSYGENAPQLKEKRQFVYTTGATSWFLTRKAALDYDKNLDRFLEQLESSDLSEWDDPRWSGVASCGCHDVYFGLLFTLLGYKMSTNKEWDRRSDAFAIDAGPEALDWRQASELPMYHYVPPYRMYALDQRVTHEKIDRIMNADRPDELVEYFREFVDEHFEVLRRRQADVWMLAPKLEASGVNGATFDEDVADSDSSGRGSRMSVSAEHRFALTRQVVHHNDIRWPVRDNLDSVGTRKDWIGERDYESMCDFSKLKE